MVLPESQGQDFPTPLQRLETISSLDILTPNLVQEAINYLDPDSPEAIIEAEIVLGFAHHGTMLHPDDPEWAEILERSTKIYKHRLTKNSS